MESNKIKPRAIVTVKEIRAALLSLKENPLFDASASLAILYAVDCIDSQEEMMETAQRLFQCGGPFSSLLQLGDKVTVGGFVKMAAFCEAHAEEFMEYSNRPEWEVK